MDNCPHPDQGFINVIIIYTFVTIIVLRQLFFVSSCPVAADCRSRMNIPMRIGSEEGDEQIEKLFLEEAQKNGMMSLKGHRSVGGIRISIYNAITVDETNKLVSFMKEFQRLHK